MKLVSFRVYKNDISDIINIINEDKNITLKRIKEAYENLYGSYDQLEDEKKKFLEELFKYFLYNLIAYINRKNN